MPLTIKKIRNWIFLLLIFFLPTQLGKHFWPSWSLVNGVRIDYLAPTIYVTDFLIAILFLLTILEVLSKTKVRRFRLYILIFLIVLIPLIAHISPISLIKFFKILEIFAFAWIVKKNLNKRNYRKFILILSFSILFESVLAILQFFNHGSLNGIFYWFGERNFSSGTPGIANAVINGSLVLRPYGTLPHPNVLAGYLLIGIIIQMTVKQWNSGTVKMEKILSNVAMKQWNNTYYIFVVIFSSIALMLTMSRVAILLYGFFLLVFIYTKYKIRNTKYFSVFVCVSLLLFFAVLLSPRFLSIFGEDKESYIKRIEQSQIAISMIKDHPIFGVGLNQYLVELPKYIKGAGFRDYQPVHNVFLLFMAETGLVGVLLILFFSRRFGLTRISSGFLRIKNLKSKIKNLNSSSCIRIFVYSSILVLSLFDHYFYTTQQGNLMIGLILGTTSLKCKSQNAK